MTVPVVPVTASLSRSGLVRAVAGPASVLLLVVVAVISLASNGLLGALTVTLVLCGAVVVTLVPIARVVVAVEVTPTEVIITRLLGQLAERSTRVPRAGIGRAVLVRGYERLGSRVVPQLFLLDPGRRRRLRLSGEVFDPAGLDRLAAALERDGRTEVDVVDRVVTGAMLAERYPGIVRVHERRPVLTIVAVIVVLTCASVLIGILVEAVAMLTGSAV